MNKKIKTIVITGPTASGKTSVAVELSAFFNGEIISVDSRQVYRGLDIGSGKDISEYSAGPVPVPYHLIDIVNPSDDYNLMSFCIDAENALKNIVSRGRLPFLAGGSALYLNAFLRGYTLPGGPPDTDLRNSFQGKSSSELLDIMENEFPELFENFREKNNRTRIIRAMEKARGVDNTIAPFAEKLSPLVIGVYRTRKEIHRRIEARLDERLKNGMIEEVECLHNNGLSWERLDYFGLEYRYLARYLQKKISFAEMRENLFIRIRQFAKSQDVWFRKMEREGLVIHWIAPGNKEKYFELIEDFLADNPLPIPEIQISKINYGEMP
ncbi:MAG: tRNA (adenosine(37)-N6)-dimethylallyltransferase MiaA [Lentisphaerae bacterium GWF2_44_16]|nr:MAG: tRNA (adenosine(37)-N6)-dimethylallyltransferase MiaA [Lentisphaerae bacterium GWF2_44_16]